MKNMIYGLLFVSSIAFSQEKAVAPNEYQVIECKITELPKKMPKDFDWEKAPWKDLQHAKQIKVGQIIAVGEPTSYNIFSSEMVDASGILVLSAVNVGNGYVQFKLNYEDQISNSFSPNAVAAVDSNPDLYDTQSGYLISQIGKDRNQYYSLSEPNRGYGRISRVSVSFRPSRKSSKWSAYCDINLPREIGLVPNPLENDKDD